MKYLLLTFALSLCGCYTVSSEDAELRTVPVTNNQHIIPNSGKSQGMPGVMY